MWMDMVPVQKSIQMGRMRDRVDIRKEVISSTRIPSSRVERDWVQDMAPNVERAGGDDTPVVLSDGLFHGYERSSDDDNAGEGDDREDERYTEALEDFGDSYEEIGALDFLPCCTLGYVVREHASQRGLGQITKEDQAA
jgi:hypothetical protein